MASAFTKVLDAITGIARALIGALVGAIVVITLAAVWWRYILNAPLAWPEQVSRILFVWVTFVGAAVLYREKLHVAIDMFVIMLPKAVQRLAGWLIELLVLAFNVIFFVFGLRLSLDTLGQTYGALDISPASFYFAAPVSAGMMILYFLEELINPARRAAVRVSAGASTS
jgi:TRAP-type C4-dicarboxylate transport system permease small subunit